MQDHSAADDMLQMQPPVTREDTRLSSAVATALHESPSPDQRHRHRPPLSFVLIHETSQSCTASVSQSIGTIDSPGPFLRTSVMHGPRASSVSSNVPSSGSWAFRLQPRGRTASSPFSSSSRGRKRNSQCLSPCSTKSGDTSSLVNSSSPRTQEGDIQGQPAVESAMLSLSIKSPKITRMPLDFAPATSPSMRGGRLPSRSFVGSSFISYTSSPGGGPSHLRATKGDSMGSVGSSRIQSMSPASSSKSSPHFASLTVLPMPGHSTGTPTKLPPRHGGPSSFLHSLDGSQHQDAGIDMIDEPVTPTAPPKAVACSPAVSTASSITKDFTPARPPKRNLYPSTPEQTPGIGSPSMRTTPHMSPATPSRIKSAHRTPLPSVKLTPRSTPRSRSSNRDGSMQTTPCSAQDLGLLPVDFVFSSSPLRGSSPLREPERRTFPGLYSPRLGDDTASTGFAYAPPPPILPPTQPSYLPIPDWCNDALGATEYTHSGGYFPPRVPTTSLLAPSVAGGFLDNIISEQERAAAMDADNGSLSDPDEEEPFVLTNPALLAGERQSFGPARQRQRLSYPSLDQANARASSMSLTSTHASNTSLRGVDFIRGDSMASLSRQNIMGNGHASRTLFKLDTPGRAEGDWESSGSALAGSAPNSGRSDNGYASIGLAIEPAFDAPRDGEERDLVTPPPVMEDRCCPPLAPSSHGDQRNHSYNQTPPPRSVCISSSNPNAVNETIAMMASQSGHSHTYSPQMECLT
jgi:hypothetical protein